ncbi:MAG: alpha/beta fold hydrolase [Trueperaceae bacterium]
MPFRLKISLALFLTILVAMVFVPFILPAPPLVKTVTEQELAHKDSLFIDINDVTLHYKDTPAISQSDQTFILLHGFGSAVFTWDSITPKLAEYGRVIAFDRPAFGLTERPLRGSWQGENPYSPESQVSLLLGLMDALKVEKAVLIGNSAGGTITTHAALEHPERVAGLVLVDAAIYGGGGAPAWVRPLLHTPQMNRLGPLAMRQISEEPGTEFLKSAWSNPENIPKTTWDSYRELLQTNNWDKALWELTKASRRPTFTDELLSLGVPTLVLSGADDTIVPVRESERLAEDIPNSTLVTFPTCGHTPQEECPGLFTEAVTMWLKQHFSSSAF